MARKSRKADYVNVGNKENLVTEAENQCEKVSHAALYARLSYESEKNRKISWLQRNIMIYLKPELILREMVLMR